MYEGQALLKLYEDMACTKEIKRTINGDYVDYVPVITGNSNVDFNKNIYIKNVGTHTAYNVAITALSGLYNNVTLALGQNTILPTEKIVGKLTVSFTKGASSSYVLQYKVDYDNIP